MSDQTFEALLNTMQCAVGKSPAKNAYADKRAAVLSHVADLERQLSEAQRRLADETEIVDRIWGLFGRPSYAELADKSIYDLITDLQAEVARLKADAEALLTAAEHGLSLMVTTPHNAEGEAIGKPRLYHRCAGCERAIAILQERGKYLDVDLTITEQEAARAERATEEPK